ncbi:MAG: phosphoenolpyruvate--protein phosphotransferase [Candidatus Aminicenantes bacterium]|nr:phosphoenolpyruvate--protein phosphotransferase [Candidatus Aminicenantes bacterium]
MASEYIRLRGIGVSPGIALGSVRLAERVVFTSRKEIIPPEEIDKEIDRLRRSFQETKRDIAEIKNQVRDKLGKEHAFIFEAHLLILEDNSLRNEIENLIRKEQVRAEWAISRIHDHYMKVFETLEDEYFRQRRFDLSDVLSKVYRHLQHYARETKEDDAEKILVAHELLPSEAAIKLGKGNILGVALDMGGQTSHTAILARSLNIPAVVGLRDITKKVKDGDVIIVDGTDGEVIINPPLAIRKEFISKKKKYDDYLRELRKTSKLASETLDGVRFFPLANIELPEEVSLALSLGAEGIGLFRSEFIYLRRTTIPSEEDHYQVYSQIAKKAFPFPVYIRTIDIGGEKNIPQLNIEREPNPALGLRAIRFSLKNRSIFRTQLRAVLKASIQKNVRLLIPMVTEMEEIEEVKWLLNEVKTELTREGVPFDPNLPLGVMIEVPAAATLVDEMIKEVDYVSIGTNDLIQYYLAVDRSNELVAYLYKPLHPSLLRLLKWIITSVQEAEKEVTVCGEMAADPLCALVLLGFGLRHFSMNPIFIPRIKKVLRCVEREYIKEMVEEALKLRTAQEIEEFLLERILVKYPQAFLMREITEGNRT